MILGTTPTHVFGLPVSPEEVADLRITYVQKRRVVLVKEGKDCILHKGDDGGWTASVELSQQDTFRFNPRHEAEVQMRLLTTNGNALVSSIEQISVVPCLGNEVIK